MGLLSSLFGSSKKSSTTQSTTTSTAVTTNNDTDIGDIDIGFTGGDVVELVKALANNGLPAISQGSGSGYNALSGGASSPLMVSDKDAGATPQKLPYTPPKGNNLVPLLVIGATVLMLARSK